jgi:hypothetical protein
MIRPPIDLPDLRRRIYVKAKAEPSWRFWALYFHVCKRETLHEAYSLAKKNNGAPETRGCRCTGPPVDEEPVASSTRQGLRFLVRTGLSSH